MIFIISGALYGAFEVALLSLVLKNVLTGNMTKSVIFLLAKFISYGVAFSLVYFFFMESVKFLAIGYTLGVIVSIPLILFFSKKNTEKTKKEISIEGDDKE
jgi:uncharacterized MAPEG superfamily protein